MIARANSRTSRPAPGVGPRAQFNPIAKTFAVLVFPVPRRAGEQVGVGYAVRFYGPAQGADDRLLAGDLGEGAGGATCGRGSRVSQGKYSGQPGESHRASNAQKQKPRTPPSTGTNPANFRPPTPVRLSRST